MTKLTIQWPDAHAEQVEAAKGRLDVARRRLVARSPEGILSVLATVFDQWRDPQSKWRQRFREEFPQTSGFSREVAENGLDLALAEWTGDALRRAVEAELQGTALGSPRWVSPFSMTSVVLAGAIPMPSLLAMVLPLCVRSPVLVKSAARDPITPRLLAESLAEVDPELGRCIEVVSFSGSDGESLTRFLAAECVVASGSDETIAAVSARIRPSQRFVAYGHKLSIAIVRAGTRNDEELGAIAEALSVDIALWDQLGCLSPVAAFVMGENAEKTIDVLGPALADSLARRQSEWPRGEISLEAAAAIRGQREEARMRAAGGSSIGIWASEGTEWTVIGEADLEWRPNPLHRFIRLHPLEREDQLPEVLSPVVRNLSSVALAGFENDSERTAIAQLLSQRGAGRVCRAGRLQAPPMDWYHDGLPLVLPLARFTGLEISVD